MTDDIVGVLYYMKLFYSGSLHHSDFDQHAHNATSKVLCVIFLLLILFSNALLIYKNVRNFDFYTRPKNQIIISMAIADVFFALFPLVVLAKALFGDYPLNLETCRLIMLSVTFVRYLIHFVYGLGICVLGIELIFRNKINNMTTSNTSKILVSIALSGFPWIMGIIVVLPLCWANMDFITCTSYQTRDQAKAATVISVILPACAVVIISIIVNCCAFTSTRHQQQAVTSPPMVIVSTGTSSSQMQSEKGFTAPQPVQQYPQQPIPGEYPLEQFSQQKGNPPANQPHAIQQPNTTAQPKTVAQPYTLAQHSQGVYLQNSTGKNLSIVHREKTKLLAIAIVFILLVVPQAIFILSYSLSPYKTQYLTGVEIVGIGDFLLWTMVIRSFVTPLIMYCYSDD